MQQSHEHFIASTFHDNQARAAEKSELGALQQISGSSEMTPESSPDTLNFSHIVMQLMTEMPACDSRRLLKGKDGLF
jgi:hypothetical protein